MDQLDYFRDPKLHILLFAIDRDLAACARRDGCRHCGGVLHSAQYPRKARGEQFGVPDDDRLSRFSFCLKPADAERRPHPFVF